MSNIWSFCLQTLTVTLSALLLLLIKRLLEDKLSPRWQYGIWCLLALRCLLPATIHRDVLLPLGLWLETGKSLVEAGLHSAYSAVFSPISLSHPLPIPTAAPQSVTDWLFVIYAAGVVLFALFYLISYIALRLRLRRGLPPCPGITEAMTRVCSRYGLKPCPVVAVPGLESAFVTGLIRPVLAVPANEAVDEKVILHELLHLKYRDIPQNIFWAALRCLHWCNPVMHFVFDRIGNDMESLCDQRVLERLEGEERREYGHILLSMASRRYARTPGTGSISNGRRNISRRIAAIARFKQYPRGMALVSVCIALVLIAPLLLGTAASASLQPGEENRPQLFAAARVRRCSTVAGAIDTYAKGLMQQNFYYLAVATPLSDHETLSGQMSEEWYHRFGSGLEFLSGQGYSIYDLTQTPGGGYHAYLAFEVADFVGSVDADWPTDNKGTPVRMGTLVIPVEIIQEDGFWTVRERSQRIQAHQRYDQIQYYGDDIPWLAESTVTTKTGTIHIAHRGIYTVDNSVQHNDLFGWTSFDASLRPDATFASGYTSSQVVYTCDLPQAQLPKGTAALRVWSLNSLADLDNLNTDDPLSQPDDSYSSISGSSSDGSAYTVEQAGRGWDRKLISGGGGGFYSMNVDPEDLPPLPAAYYVQILFDDVVVDEIVIEVNQNG